APLLHPLRHRRIVTDRGEELDVGVGDLQQRLLHAVPLDDLAVIDVDPVRVGVVRDRGVEVAHRDGDVVDLGEHGRVAHVLTSFSSWRRNSVICGSSRSRMASSVTPSPSFGASTRTPSFPSCRFLCTWYAASPTSSKPNTADNVGWIWPSQM